MEVFVTEEAQKQFTHLPKKEQSKIKKKLLVLEQNPYEGKKLEGNLSRYRTVRAWPYRILYAIEDQRIVIKSIFHRQKGY